MVLVNEETNERYKGLIEKLSEAEVEKLKGNSNFTFAWNEEQGALVYKLMIKGKKEILGLVSVADIREEFRLHINLLEASKKHRGKGKGMKNIPGCMLAFVCRESFRKGYGGFVSLLPKTYLIDYYQKNYGFVQVGRQLAIFGNNSKVLVGKFLEDEEV